MVEERGKVGSCVFDLGWRGRREGKRGRGRERGGEEGRGRGEGEKEAFDSLTNMYI